MAVQFQLDLAGMRGGRSKSLMALGLLQATIVIQLDFEHN